MKKLHEFLFGEKDYQVSDTVKEISHEIDVMSGAAFEEEAVDEYGTDMADGYESGSESGYVEDGYSGYEDSGYGMDEYGSESYEEPYYE